MCSFSPLPATHCPELSIANGDVVYTDETNFGSIADVQCNFGFTYISTDSLPLECLASGDWSPPIGNCSSEYREMTQCEHTTVVQGNKSKALPPHTKQLCCARE